MFNYQRCARRSSSSLLLPATSYYHIPPTTPARPTELNFRVCVLLLMSARGAELLGAARSRRMKRSLISADRQEGWPLTGGEGGPAGGGAERWGVGVERLVGEDVGMAKAIIGGYWLNVFNWRLRTAKATLDLYRGLPIIYFLRVKHINTRVAFPAGWISRKRRIGFFIFMQETPLDATNNLRK